ncbi:hypothetical protein [Protofrankia coriariae]|uniref:hypothetical protein n=1 Tax=Protofrankia coriariae TaxID=1562887 RepID=UPI0009778BC4|nr:hypothetical protein [Protofrankia coriariae]
MNAVASVSPLHHDGQRITLHAVTVLIASVVALSFLFGLGNVWALGIRLGVPAYIAPLVAPAVDLSVVALLLATRQLALGGASREQIQPAQRLLIFCSLVTLALNTAEPIIEGYYGRAAFDAVGCCLLIGWSHIGPELLQSLQATAGREPAHPPAPRSRTVTTADHAGRQDPLTADHPMPHPRQATETEPRRRQKRASDQDLLDRARAEDALHWQTHHRPISAETLRKRLHVGARTARGLVAQLRTGSNPRPDSAAELDHADSGSESLPATV